MDIVSDKLIFPGAGGGMLAARFDRPAGSPVKATALLAHCFTCSKESHAATRIARALAGLGIAVLRFDFTGLGGSDGEFGNTGFASNVADLVAAAAFLRERGEAPSLLIGHSLGGAAALVAAGQVPEVRAVVTIAAPAETSHLRRLFADATVGADGSAEMDIGGRRFRIGRRFIDDLGGDAVDAAVAQLRRALLVFHAPMDDVVGIDNATRIFIAAKHPKSFVSIDGADHLLTDPEDAAYVARVTAAWAVRYVPGLAAAQPSELGPPALPGWVEVEEAGSGRYAQRVRVGRHLLRADEPERVGGNDSGPGPYDLLSAALGACTSMTLRMYAERKGWPLRHVRVRLQHDKVHAADCVDCEKRVEKIDRIERVIRIEGELDDAQRARLLEIADRCPVHQTLHRENQIVTRAEE